MSRHGTASDDGYDSAVRCIRDMYRKGSLRTSGLDVVMEDAEQDASSISSSSSCSNRVRKAPTCACLSSLLCDEDDSIRQVSEKKLSSPVTDEDEWGFFGDDDRQSRSLFPTTTTRH